MEVHVNKKLCISCGINTANPKGLRCTPCYTKTTRKNGLGRCIECKEFKYIIKKQVTCNACYERYRRRNLKRKDPEYVKRKTRENYLNSKLKGFYATSERRANAAVYAYFCRDPNSTITAEWFVENVINGRCYYCGLDDEQSKLFYKKKD